MTSIISDPLLSQYTNYVTGTGSGTQQLATDTETSSQSTEDSATTVTLSDEAQAVLSKRDQVIADALAKMTVLLADTGRTSPVENDKLVVDLSMFDREQIYAMASNADQKFSVDEVKAGGLELQRRFDAALSGPAAVVRATGDFEPIYQSAREYLDAMTDEEKATATWRNQSAAVNDALRQLEEDPDRTVATLEDDPVLDYLSRVASGDADGGRDFTDIAKDARVVLDKIYDDAEAAGRGRGTSLDVSEFNGQFLSAVALNESNTFSRSEVHTATMEMRSRSSQALLQAYKLSKSSDDPTSFSKNIISAYGSMTAEERQAAGWSEDFFGTVLGHYHSSGRIAEMFSATSTQSGGTNLFNYI